MVLCFNKLRCLIFVIASLLLTHKSLAKGQDNIDSLKKVIQTTDDDSIKISAYEEWEKQLDDSDQQGSIELKTKIIAICDSAIADDSLIKQIFIHKSLSKNLYDLGRLYSSFSDFYQAIQYFTRALSVAEKIGDMKRMAIVNNGMGVLHSRLENYEFAKSCLEQSLKCAEQVDDQTLSIFPKGNLIRVYTNLGRSSEQDEAYKDTAIIKYKELIVQLDDVLQANPDEWESKERYSLIKAKTLNNIAVVYVSKEEYDTAKFFSNQAMAICETYQNTLGIAFSLSNLSKCALGEGKIDLSIKLAKESLKRTDSKENKALIAQILEVLYKGYAKKKNFELAFDYYQQHNVVKDSILSEEKLRAAIQQQYKVEFEKKSEADSLAHLNEKLLRDKEIERQKLTLENERTQKSILYLLVVLLTFVILAVYIGFRQNQKVNRLIENKKSELEEYQRKMLDSITYAQKIQSSLQPEVSVIQKHLPGFNNLSLPKDIVSGDFYWFHHENDISYLVLSDCTGHGVPGAFMSMIGISLLNEVVINKKITDLTEILERIDAQIQALFCQHSKDASEDGMEVGILKYYHLENKIEFAGAKQNLYLVKEDATEIVKGSIRPIGGWIRNQSKVLEFTSQSISLDNLKSIYMATDGLEDQLGGPHFRKFGRMRLLEMIKNNAVTSSMSMLKEALVEWRGKFEQLDDVSIIGMDLNDITNQINKTPGKGL